MDLRQLVAAVNDIAGFELDIPVIVEREEGQLVIADRLEEVMVVDIRDRKEELKKLDDVLYSDDGISHCDFLTADDVVWVNREIDSYNQIQTTNIERMWAEYPEDSLYASMEDELGDKLIEHVTAPPRSALWLNG